jgi:hypothetical protein
MACIRQFSTFLGRFGIAIALLAFSGCVSELQSNSGYQQPLLLLPGDRVLHLKSPLTPELLAIATEYTNAEPDFKEDVGVWEEVTGLHFNIREDMGGAFANIGNDGEPEAFLRFNAFDCGNDECSTAIFKKFAGHWQPICKASSYSDDVVILNVRDHGINRILLNAGSWDDPNIAAWQDGQCVDAPDPPYGDY